MRRSARFRERSCWDPSARWRVRSSDLRQGPRSRIPGEFGGPHRDRGFGMQHNRASENPQPKSLERRNKLRRK